MVKTMISDNERREVAARLRNGGIARDSEEAYVLLLSRVGIRPQLPATSTYEAAMVRLADLIDRPTCHMEGTSRSGFRCSACGEQIPPMRIFYRDSAGDHWVPMEHNRCPRCGAEVVKCDE